MRSIFCAYLNNSIRYHLSFESPNKQNSRIKTETPILQTILESYPRACKATLVWTAGISGLLEDGEGGGVDGAKLAVSMA